MDRLSQMNAQFAPATGAPADAQKPTPKDSLSVLDNRTGKHILFFFYIY